MSKKKYNAPSVNAILLDSDFMLNAVVKGLDSSKTTVGDANIGYGGVDKDGIDAESRKKETGDSWSWE